jgi:hypothetical protein
VTKMVVVVGEMMEPFLEQTGKVKVDVIYYRIEGIS